MAELVARSSIGSVAYLAPSGSLGDENMQAALAGAVRACVETNSADVVLDLDRVPLVNGRGLEVILDASDRLIAAGGSLKFVNASPLVSDILIANGITSSDPSSAVGANTVMSMGQRLAPQPNKIGEILIEMGLISDAQRAEALQLQTRSGKQLGSILIEKRTISETDLYKALSRQSGMPYIALRPGLYEPAAAAMVPGETARRLNVLPMFKVRDTLTLATADAQAIPAFDEIQSITGGKLCLVLSRRDEITKCYFEAYSTHPASGAMVGGMEGPGGAPGDTAGDIELVEQERTDFTAIDQMAGGSSVINLVNGLIQRAVSDGASDIHIECSRARGMVRFRIDGILHEIMQVRPDMHPAIVSRLKVMAKLDIAERRMPQDGRLQVTTQGRTIDLRFSSLAGIYGEKVVLRILDRSQAILDIDKIGMTPSNLAMFKKLLGRSYGMVLVTGPTGSGKTTTLYAAVNFLKSIEKNIVTIEDPVEYQIDIINQNQVNEATGLGFARMLRHILRQDPDIIMVGEIRDRETAEIAVQAALTGHLVLSTLHTNDAVGALSRMMEMGVEPYLLSSALAGVVAQRLVRRVCPTCSAPFTPSPELAAAQGWPVDVKLAKGRGCPACYDSGYRGRMGIHEIIVATADLERVMIRNPSKEDLQAFIHKSGHTSLYQDGMQRVLEGRTSLEEVARVIHET
ncbi:MAG: Flp pilus assembly complex ATPase component TadA [Betaproteobacteria bacterium]|nr:Flp pilus assembly complex ATPase component TadA [Betaproteobacteria bacterium]